jgi:hypothetical protein
LKREKRRSVLLHSRACERKPNNKKNSGNALHETGSPERCLRVTDSRSLHRLPQPNGATLGDPNVTQAYCGRRTAHCVQGSDRAARLIVCIMATQLGPAPTALSRRSPSTSPPPHATHPPLQRLASDKLPRWRAGRRRTAKCRPPSRATQHRAHPPVPTSAAVALAGARNLRP